MLSTLSIKPAPTISRWRTLPVANTMALGGVPTGSINAHDAPMPITSASTRSGSPICAAMLANIGTSSAAEAVLLVKLVSKIIKLVTATITTPCGAPLNNLATSLPSAADAPEWFIMLLNAMLPPNKNNTPKSVLRATSRQPTVPNTTTSAAAISAMMLSIDAMPVARAICPLNTHASAVPTAMMTVNTRCKFHGISSVCVLAMWAENWGRNTANSAINISGSNTSIIGKP